MSVIFFDLGGTLGEPRLSQQGRLEGFDTFAFVPDLLGSLRDQGHRLGVISNTGTEKAKDMERVLTESGIFGFFEPELLLYSSVVGLRKDSPQIFVQAAERAGNAGNPDECLYVGENGREVCFALDAKLRITRSPDRIADVLAQPADALVPDIGNLAACIEDARLAMLDSDPGPDDPTVFSDLIGRISAARLKMPPLYRQTFVIPFSGFLQSLGASEFSTLLIRDPKREQGAGLVLDVAHAILQNSEKFEEKATDAYQEVVSDLYDGFLSAHDRRGIKPPDNVVIAPLVKWGNPGFGPYTWPIDATSQLDVRAAVVSLPPSHAHRGLVGWSALAHETAGHDILHADEGLAAEMSTRVQNEISRSQLGFGLAQYWAQRIDETASDVMGILNMGPAAGIGLIAYFRGLNQAFSGTPRLRSEGPARDLHPADILRGYLAAATVRLLSFQAAPFWANAIEQETDRDLRQIRLGGLIVPVAAARKSADIVAEVLATHTMQALNNHSLIEVQDWDDVDEEICTELRRILTTSVLVPEQLISGVFAAHVVSAAVTVALQGGSDLSVLFRRMVAVLKMMHDRNPSWGPMFVAQPSTITRHVMHLPFADEQQDEEGGAGGSSVRAVQIALAARGKTCH